MEKEKQVHKDTNALMKNVTEKFVNLVKETYLKNKKEINIDIVLEEVEMDEMWNFYHDKKHLVWLWWAVEHQTNTPTAFVFGTREHKYLDELLSLLTPYKIKKDYTDNNFAYSSRISEDILMIGKKNTQKIERDHLTLRTRIKRLARKTICFSKNLNIHKAVIGTFINILFYNRHFDFSTLL